MLWAGSVRPTAEEDGGVPHAAVLHTVRPWQLRQLPVWVHVSTAVEYANTHTHNTHKLKLIGSSEVLLCGAHVTGSDEPTLGSSVAAKAAQAADIHLASCASVALSFTTPSHTKGSSEPCTAPMLRCPGSAQAYENR